MGGKVSTNIIPTYLRPSQVGNTDWNIYIYTLHSKYCLLYILCLGQGQISMVPLQRFSHHFYERGTCLHHAVLRVLLHVRCVSSVAINRNVFVMYASF